MHWLQTFSPVLNWTKRKEQNKQCWNISSASFVHHITPISIALGVSISPFLLYAPFFFLFGLSFFSSLLQLSLEMFSFFFWTPEVPDKTWEIGKMKRRMMQRTKTLRQGGMGLFPLLQCRAVTAWVKPTWTVWRVQASSVSLCHILFAFLPRKPLVWS